MFLQIGEASLKLVGMFKYLKVAFTSDGTRGEESNSLLSMPNAMIRVLHHSVVLKHGISRKTNFRFFQTIFVTILNCGQEIEEMRSIYKKRSK